MTDPDPTVSRRTLLAAGGSSLSLMAAGCLDRAYPDADADAGGDGNGGVEELTATVHVSYRGSWSGVVRADGDAQRVGGNGPDVAPIDTTPDTQLVSALINKDDTTGDRLTVELCVNDRVEASASTDAPLGTVTVCQTIQDREQE